MRASLCLVPCLLCFSLLASAQNISLNPGKEVRSLNTATYQIAVQRNGRLDVALTSGELVFENVFPMVWFAEEEKPKRLKVDGRLSNRFAVNDRFGTGQGIVLKKDNCEWYIRAYPAQPFFAVQAAYINTTKKATIVQSIMPWCVGSPKKGAFSLGAREGEISFITYRPGSPPATELSAQIFSERQAVANCPANGRSLIIGFLSHARSRNTFRFEQTPKADAGNYDLVRSTSTFTPPIVVQPGERIESAVLYIAVAETDPREGLRRLARITELADKSEDDNR